jgi:F-type H+-transporting ATPase subunit b
MHEPVLVPDMTIFIQLGIFLLSYAILRKFLFLPYLELLKERNRLSIGLKEEAIKAKEEAEKLKSEYETKLLAEKKNFNTWYDSERRKITEQERNSLNEVKETAQKEYQIVNAKLEEEARQVRLSLKSQLLPLAGELASKLIGKKVELSAASTNGDAFSSQETRP